MPPPTTYSVHVVFYDRDETDKVGFYRAEFAYSPANPQGELLGSPRPYRTMFDASKYPGAHGYQVTGRLPQEDPRILEVWLPQSFWSQGAGPTPGVQ